MQLCMYSFSWIVTAVLLLVSFSMAEGQGSDEVKVPINSGWQFRQRTTETTETTSANWRPASVPGVVDTDLLTNKLIPDPFYRENEAKLQWIENADWEYRSVLQVTPEMLRRRHIDLVFDGLDGYAEVFLNGHLVLTADNAFRQWRSDVKNDVKPGANELLVVFPSPISKAKEIASKDPWRSRSGTEEKTYIRKPAYEYGWDWGPRFVNSGIWRPVRLELWDRARVADFHIRQLDITADTAQLVAEVEVQASQPGPAKVSLSYMNRGKKYEQTREISLHAGSNTAQIPFSIAKPELWFPTGYGPQNLYSFSLQLSGTATGSATRRTGLRSVVLRRDVDKWGRSFEFVINGIPVFGKGADVIPFDSFPSRVTTADYRRVLQSARDANMNMIRHWGGGYYETDEFYDLCDELGILVWQDFMFGNDWQPGSYSWKEGVQKEAEYQVRRLRDHPSIVLWCGNNETEGAFGWNNRWNLPAEVRIRMWQDYLTVFSGILPRAVERLAPEIPYWPSSPSSDYEDTKPEYQTGDMHNWNIWHGMEPLRDYEKYFPRFMSEYGFQSFPEMRTIEAFTLPDDRTGITTKVMLSHQKNAAGNQKIHDYMLRDYAEPKDFASFLYVSQVLQAEAIKIGAEHLRRIRPRAMGSLFWQLNDCWPVASWSSIDYLGRWKALQYYARRFYAPLLVSPHEEDGKIAVYVVSDATLPTTATLNVTLMTASGKVLRTKSQSIQVPPLSSTTFFMVPREEYMSSADIDPSSTVLFAELVVGGHTVSSNTLYFVAPKVFDLVPAQIDSEITAQGNAYRLSLKSNVLARTLRISFGDLDATVSDNYFDLLPGKVVEIDIRSAASLERLRNEMSVTSLADAFSAPAKALAAP
jgi:beta-mannosidase